MRAASGVSASAATLAREVQNRKRQLLPNGAVGSNHCCFSFFSRAHKGGITLSEQIGRLQMTRGDNMLLTRRAVIGFALAGLVAGCANSTKTARALTGRAAYAVVTAQELSGARQQGSLMDALVRLRPSWLTSRGATPGLSVDGGSPTDADFLRLIPVSDVREVRFERSTSSLRQSRIATNGDVIVGNMIVVTTRRGDGR